MGNPAKSKSGFVWPASIGVLKAKASRMGYVYWSPDTVRFFKSRTSEFLFQGRVFVESVQREVGEPRTYCVKLVEKSEQWHWSVTSIGAPDESATSPGVARQRAQILASYVHKGLIPDELEYGMDCALQHALGIEGGLGTNGWSFHHERGFEKADS